MAQEKKHSGTVLTFWSTELDTVAQISWLPLDKLMDLQSTVTLFLATKKTTVKELQQLMGHLNFTCREVAPVQAFFSSYVIQWTVCACPIIRSALIVR